jgi:hypothetical protein
MQSDEEKEERIPIGQAMFDELFPFFMLSLANCCPTPNSSTTRWKR